MKVSFFLMDRIWATSGPWFNVASNAFDDRVGPIAHAKERGRRSLSLLVDPAEMPEDYIPEVVQKVAGDDLATLHIAAHGDSGELRLGKGLKYEWLGAFEGLRACFPREGWAEKVIKIYGCAVAGDARMSASRCTPTRGCPRGVFSGRADAKGYRFLSTLATITGAAVQASMDFTPNFAPYFFSFQGTRTVHFYPGGGHLRLNYRGDGAVKP